MLLKNFKSIFIQELSTLYDEKEIESFFYRVMESYHGLKRIDLALQPGIELDALQVSQWVKVVLELKKHKPIQYILGETEFFGLPFTVNENVLIPRPETEELVALILNDVQQSNAYANLNILDVGTGSGCIPIALKKNLPEANVYAIDVSEKALETATNNANQNGVEVNFLIQNILETEDLNRQFDIIVSNPPYVRNLEKNEIHANVLEYEPHLALFVEDNDALLFYRKISDLARKHLTSKGRLYFEINQYLGQETLALVASFGFKEVILHQDIYGNDRMIAASL